MREKFEKKLAEQSQEEILTDPDLNNLMCLWYGCLYVVIEGWKDLRFKNHEVNGLLMSGNVDLLRGCRNDTFHFQKKYYPSRYVKFVTETDSAKWVRDLNMYFGKFFMEEFDRRKKK